MEAYQKLEERWSEFTGMHAVVCSSGTSALHLALLTLKACHPRLQGNVAIPDFTMIACPRAAVMAGMNPLFVPSSKSTLNIDWHFQVEEYCDQEQVDIIMPVHIYGRLAPVDRVTSYAWKRGCYIIEDLAEAHGLPAHPKTTVACWSFYKNKIIAGEEGGALAFHNEDYAEVARDLRSLGIKRGHYRHNPYGTNARLSNTNAEIILSSLNNYESNIELRRDRESLYDRLLPKELRIYKIDAPWVYPIMLPRRTQLAYEVVDKIKEESGVEARPAFEYMCKQPEWSDRTCLWRHPIDTDRIFYLPLTPTLSKNQIEKACKVINQSLQTTSIRVNIPAFMRR